MIRTRPVVGAIAIVIALTGGSGIAIATSADDPAPGAVPPLDDVLAPVVDATAWLEGPVQDLTDPGLGQFALESGFVGAVTRTVDALGELDPTDPDAFARLAQDAWDSLLHMKPDVPLTHALDTGHRDYTPDWNGNGVYGEAADYDHDVDAVADTAVFRFPCANDDGSVTFEATAPERQCVAASAPGVEFKTGMVREAKIVNARGFILDATIWLPADAAAGLPSVVFHNGLASRQDHYYWFAMRLAAAGYAVLTYDPAGQGESEGTTVDLFANHNGTLGNAMDAQDVVRWWTGQDIVAVDAGQQRPFLGFHAPAYEYAGGDNVRNPCLPLLDLSRVAIAGNSLGAMGTVTYLNAVSAGHGYDDTGRPVPPVAAAVALSIPGEMEVTAPAPLLLMSGDMDGLPLVAPAILGQGWADDHERMYASLRRDPAAAHPLGVVIIQGGIHTDHVDQAFIGSTPWGLAVTNHYAVAWLDCHIRSLSSACAALGEPITHLSAAYPTQYDADGSGPAPNVCVRPADRASLGQDLGQLVRSLQGRPVACDS